MAFPVLFDRAAERALVKLRTSNAKAAEALVAAIAVFASDPAAPGAAKMLKGGSGQRSIRAGDWRAIVTVTGSAVVVLHVGNRRDIYR